MMSPSPVIRCWKFEEWPEADRQAWEHGCTPGGLFEVPRHGASLRIDTLKGVIKAYGRWLCFLAGNDALDPDSPALRRVTLSRLADYLRQMKAAGNADMTIITRFDRLLTALKIMTPGADVSWIRKPGGVTIYRLLPNRRRRMRAPDADVMYHWSLDMMDQALAAPKGKDALRDFRDGLLLAMLASRGRRLRSMTLIRVGSELIATDRGYRVDLSPDKVKTNRVDSFSLPDDLKPYMDHYLGSIRPAILAGRCEAALWLRADGKPFMAKGIQAMVFRRTAKRFGEAFGPHRFRRAIVTTARLKAPQYPGLGAATLGISEEVAQDSYCLARTTGALATFGDLITQKRRAAGIPLRLPPVGSRARKDKDSRRL